ncbi:DMT family transporter [Catellatospora vulcania]|uniref:DMT family transporter n=1 Tax=Catellatospora vulcania TaxID=1460450 RepID=UPI0018AFBCA6|nr:DMT family transporter [Catellatospora vulcania]
MNRDSYAGAALCTFGMIILGGSFSLSRLLLDYPVLTGQTVRYTLAAALLAALLRLFPRLRGVAVRPDRRELLVLAGVALFGLVLFNVLLLTALEHADPAVVGTVVGAAPLGLALTGPLLRRERPAARLVVAALIVVGGTALVHGTGATDTVGTLAALGTLVCEVMFSLLAAIVLPRLGAVRVSAWSCGLAVPMLAVAALVAGEAGRLRPPTATETLTLLYLAVLMTVVAFLAWFTGLGRLGVERAGMFTGVVPAATLVATALQDRAMPDLSQVLGVLVVAGGLVLGATTGLKAGLRDMARSGGTVPPLPPETSRPLSSAARPARG